MKDQIETLEMITHQLEKRLSATESALRIVLGVLDRNTSITDDTADIRSARELLAEETGYED